MTDWEREYLDAMEKSFYEKARDAKISKPSYKLTEAGLAVYSQNMEFFAELVHTIKTDFEKQANNDHREVIT